MIKGGYYAQFGFQRTYGGDVRNLFSLMESGEVTQLEFKEFQDDSTVRILVQSRFRTR